MALHPFARASGPTGDPEKTHDFKVLGEIPGSLADKN
jgi:hypothetical protein